MAPHMGPHGTPWTPRTPPGPLEGRGLGSPVGTPWDPLKGPKGPQKGSKRGPKGVKMGSKRGQNGVKRAILGVPQKGTFLTPDPKMDPNPEDPLFGVPPVLCHFWIGPCIKRSKPEKGHLSPYRDREMRGPKRGQNGGLGPGGLQARVRHLRGSTGLRLYPWDPRSLCKAGPLTQGPPEGSQKGSKWGPQKGQMGSSKLTLVVWRGPYWDLVLQAI